jgi:hypothetical protein
MINMTKILENKQMVHIVSEIIILFGVIFYFSNKNKAMMNHIEELNQRLEEQEQKMDKQEQVLRNLVLQVKSLSSSQAQFNQRSVDNKTDGRVEGKVDGRVEAKVERKQPAKTEDRVERKQSGAKAKSIIIVQKQAPIVECNDSVCKIVELEEDEVQNSVEETKDFSDVDSVDLDNELKEELEELNA